MPQNPPPDRSDLSAIRWLAPNGEPVSCVEKIKVLTENLSELREIAQDAFEDALVIGCDEAQLRAVFQSLIAELANPYEENRR